AAPVLTALQNGAAPAAAALAQALAAALPASGAATLAIVAASVPELRDRLAAALGVLGDAAKTGPFPPGVYFSEKPLAADGQLAMLFSGQGSQYPDMLRDVAVAFDEVREALEEADAVLSATPTYSGRTDPRLSRLIYPYDRFGEDEEKAARAALASTDVAQPALGAVGSGLFALARRLGLSPAMVGGHSYGEYVALHAAGVLSRRDLLLASEARGRFIVGAVQGGDLGTMAAVSAEVEKIQAALKDSDVVLANFNAPKQTIISGATASVKKAIETLSAQGINATPIPVAAAFHSPLMQPAAEPLRAFLGGLDWQAPAVPIYANTTAEPHGGTAESIRDLLGRHLTEPVRFVGMIEAMYAAGARVFLEIGPKSVLADLARRILGDRPHRAVSLDGSGGGIPGLLHGIAALLAEGVAVDLAPLFAGRVAKPIDLAKLPEIGASEPVDPNLWLVNGTRARRMGEMIRVSAERPAPRAAAPQLASPQPAPAAASPGSPAPAPAARGPASPRATPFVTRGANGTLYAKEVGMDGYDGPVPRSGAPELNGPAAYAPVAGAERTMADYYQTMRAFLQVQERVMLSYLGAADTMPRPFSAPQIAAAPRFAIP
ncbi:MAG: acyltransferase domain-containing protein, partial [Proteobacteria bacterium]|nr:acyltransferase domain-containing protein [Pseudomonadota bacterium]